MLSSRNDDSTLCSPCVHDGAKAPECTLCVHLCKQGCHDEAHARHVACRLGDMRRLPIRNSLCR